MRTTCAELFENKYHNEIRGEMCPHCSSAKFSKDEHEPHWECNKYKVRLTEDENNHLVRCVKCMEKNTDF